MVALLTNNVEKDKILEVNMLGEGKACKQKNGNGCRSVSF